MQDFFQGIRGRIIAAGAFAMFAVAAAPASAWEVSELEPVTIEAEYVHDLVGVAHGPAAGVRRIDLLSLSADVSLDVLAGWGGARLFLHGIASTGGRPNDLAGSLQGINNIEVPENRVRLFEAYLEQSLPALNGSVRIGFSDLNSEFYVNDAAGLMLAPAFGVGSELASAGPNGLATFPSTAAAVRLKVEPAGKSYVQIAAVNAESGVPGDRGGVRPLLRRGALLIGEAGIAGTAKVALGAWAYTRRQDDIRLTPSTGVLAGDPATSRARGAYVLAEAPIIAGRLTGFGRAGISDGDTTDFSGGWQAGLLADAILAGRPGSQLSVGLGQAILSARHRANAAAAGDNLRRAETSAELTFSDRLAPWLTIQPDIQYVWNASRAPQSRDAVVLTLRLRAGLAWP